MPTGSGIRSGSLHGRPQRSASPSRFVRRFRSAKASGPGARCFRVRAQITDSAAERVIAERFVDANGIRLQCLEWGNRRRPAVLLVHGWDGTARYWDLVAPSLSDRYHLVAVTLRGRGRSGVDPTGEYRFNDYVS